MTNSAVTRRSEIIDNLAQGRYLKVADLSRRFGVSQMSIRRDLDQLEEQGLLRRVHGGITATPLLRLGFKISPRVVAQLRESWSENSVIARAAAALVQPGDHLIFDSGMLSYLTACTLSGNLLIQGELTVITNSLLVALELAPWSGVETILLGGGYQPDHRMNLTGSTTLQSLEGLHADKMFLTVEGIDVQHGVTASKEEAELARKMIAACVNVVLLAARNKIGQACCEQILAPSPACSLVTVPGAPAGFLSYLHSQGTEIILTQPGTRQL